MKILTTKILSILLSIALVANVTWAEDIKAKEKSDCPKIKLLKNALNDQFYGSSNGHKEPLYMSKHYCFIYFNEFTEEGMDGVMFNDTDKKRWVTKAQTRNIIKSYRKAYADLDSLEQKFNFVHLFLVGLTQKYLVTPHSFDRPRAEIIILADIKPARQTTYGFKLIRDMSDTEVLAKLNAMQANPPKAEDHPYLSKLVDAVLEKKEVISDDKLFELSSLM